MAHLVGQDGPAKKNGRAKKDENYFCARQGAVTIETSDPALEQEAGIS